MNETLFEQENMTKRVNIIHGWDGHPQDAWIPWLTKELQARSLEVAAPQMPHAEMPKLEEWVLALQALQNNVDVNTYFVCHSMGCKSTAKFLESLPDGVMVGGVVFLAGFFKRLSNLEVDEPGVPETAKKFLEVPIDFEKVRSHIRQSIAIFSDDDRFVPLDNADDFRDKLGSEIQIIQNMDHFWTKKPDWQEYYRELPILLDATLKLTHHA